MTDADIDARKTRTQKAYLKILSHKTIRYSTMQPYMDDIRMHADFRD
jgi:hypothetical protein